MRPMISTIEKGMLRRSELLLGADFMERIAQVRVIVFGVGGVGSWCAESLVRSGIRHLTIVDSDRICITNCNRQLMATSKNVGQVKVEALKSRLLEINPHAEINALQQIYEEANAHTFGIENYDYVIDAIDSLKEKAHLILHATGTPGITLFSSMGAALRINPFQIRQAEFWNVKNDALARALRNKFKRNKTFPAHKFLCVYSEEPPRKNRGENHACGTSQCICSKAKLLSGIRGTDSAVYDAPGKQNLVEHEWCTSKAQINGSLSHITGIFGFALAGMVLTDIENKFITSQTCPTNEK